jgi:predicted Fe-Mo cluster-binding NifX family protein
MKIAVPSTGKNPESFVSITLGRSPFIVIYNDETGNTTISKILDLSRRMVMVLKLQK